MGLSKVRDDGYEGVELFLHFLMVAPALLGLPRPQKQLHSLEYLVSASHVAIDKVLVVQF